MKRQVPDINAYRRAMELWVPAHKRDLPPAVPYRHSDDDCAEAWGIWWDAIARRDAMTRAIDRGGR